jgi:large subunit ribosomal protein L24
LTGVDAATFMAAATRSPVDGSLGLSAEVDGSGLSPLALIGSLQGTGKLALNNAHFAGLDPRVFKTVTSALDQGLAIDATRISDLVSKALNSGPLVVKHADGTLAVSAGQVRLRNVTVDSKDAALSLAGNLDLTDGFIDARLVLSGPNQASAANPNNSPDIFMSLTGPAAAPSAHIDVSTLIGWLTLRAVENQSKRLRAIEGASQEPRGQAIAPNGDAAPSMLAPVLPAPVDIGPAPKVGRERAPAASVRP